MGCYYGKYDFLHMTHALTKQQIRAAKALHRAQKQPPRVVRRHRMDVGCVIHGRAYDWVYVERLRSMVARNLSVPVTMHVWTEHDRSVPPDYVKHCLEDWPGISGPKKSWWYKMQMFNPEHFAGDLLYFDLDVVICDGLDWILEYSTERFWTLRDFRYLQRSSFNRMNSSMMWWNVTQQAQTWQQFQIMTAAVAQTRYHGDQDFLQEFLAADQRRFFPDQHAQSWRWSARDGGWDFATRRYRAPNTGTRIQPGASVLVFHGHPKPHEITDPVIDNLWR